MILLVLTKPLGTHVACMGHMWMEQNQEKWNRMKQVVTEQDVQRGYQVGKIKSVLYQIICEVRAVKLIASRVDFDHALESLVFALV